MNTFELYVCRLSYLINLMTSRKLFMWTRLFIRTIIFDVQLRHYELRL